MFIRVFALLPLALLASASPLQGRDDCHADKISCCNSVQSIPQVLPLLEALGLAQIAAALGANIGLTCTSVSVLGISKGCEVHQQPVCCQNNTFNGLINFGCAPINL